MANLGYVARLLSQKGKMNEKANSSQKGMLGKASRAVTVASI
jgi:hypothetical protein